VGAFDETRMNIALGIPGSARVHAVLPIGYADEKPKMPIKQRLYSLVYFEKFGNRIENLDLVLSDYSNIIEKKVKKTSKKTYGFLDKMKEHVEKLKRK